MGFGFFGEIMVVIFPYNIYKNSKEKKINFVLHEFKRKLIKIIIISTL